MAIFYEPEYPAQRYEAHGPVHWIEPRDFIKCCVCQRYQKYTENVIAFQQSHYLQFCCDRCRVPEWFQPLA
jgi:hypothetical protein